MLHAEYVHNHIRSAMSYHILESTVYKELHADHETGAADNK